MEKWGLIFAQYIFEFLFSYPDKRREMKLTLPKKPSNNDLSNLLKLQRKASYSRLNWRASLFLMGLSFLLAMVLMPGFTLPRRTFVEGELAPRNIKAYRSFEIVDMEASQKLKDAAESVVKSIFDYDSRLYAKTVQKLFRAFDRMRKDYYKEPGGTLASPHTSKDAQKAFVEALGGILIPDDLFSYLEQEKFSWKISWTVSQLMNLLKNRYVIAERDTLTTEIDRGIIIKNLENNKEIVVTDFGRILDVDDAKRGLLIGTARIYRDLKRIEIQRIGELAGILIFPNLSFNTAETKKRKEIATAEIKPTIIKVEKGEIIVRKNEPIQKRHLVILEGIRRQFTEQRPALFIFFTAIFLFFFFQIIGHFALSNFPRFNPTGKDILVMGLVVLILLLLARGYLFATSAIIDKFSWLPTSMFIYFIPIAASAMIVRFLLGMEGALIFSFATGLTFSLLLEKNFYFALYTLSGCFIGIQSISYCRAHMDIYKAGLKVAISNVAIVFAIIILNSLSRSATVQEILIELIFGLAAGFFSGIFSSIIVVAVTPFFEYLFGYTTDLKLLELSNLNNPLLKDLMIRAPGSYHHSIMVGTLAEHAAQAVGANALLARIGGYYHDIGKMRNPHYFIENQFGGFNIHDHQPPHLSKTMIQAHVKEGIKIGEERNLGKRVTDLIGQHHGTSLTVYFYEKAKMELLERKEATGEGTKEVHEVSVDENDFRYGGPRPQSVEAAIVMMADSIEAATRALNTSNLGRLKVVCEKIVNRLFKDNQLDDCDLTLRDLGRIIDSFHHVLIGIYHRRISYPGGVVAEQPYDANYYPKQTKDETDSDTEDKDVDQNSIFKKMGC